MASDVDVRHPHGDAIEGQLVSERQPDRSGTGTQVGDDERTGQRPRQLYCNAGDDLGFRPGDQHPLIDGELEVSEAPVAEHVRQRLAGL